MTVYHSQLKKVVLPMAVLVGLLPAAVAAENITIVGTGDGIKVLQSIGKVFSEIHPGITVIVPASIGSSGGIKAVGNDKYRLGRVARKIKNKEKPYGLSYRPFAKVSVTFFVNHSVDVSNLSTKEILGIYSGQIKNWQDVGAPSGKIRVVRREDGDSSLQVLQAYLPGFSDIVLTEKSKTTTTTQQTVEVVSDTTGAIGFGPYPEARQAGLGIVSIDGQHPNDPSYESAAVLALIFKKENNTGAIGKFVKFATSPAAAEAIRNAHGRAD